MATPSEAEVITQWKNLTKLFDVLLVTEAADWISREDTYVQSIESNFPAEQLDGIRSARARLNDAILSYPDCLAPILREYGRIMVVPETDARSLIFRLYQWLKDNSATVKSRGISDGTPTFSGATGNGTINRLTTDRYGYKIEARFMEVKTAECFADQNSGTDRHRESFIFRGAAPARDSLAPTGYTGQSVAIQALASSDSIILNPSFSVYTGSAAAPSAIDSWTAGTIGNYAIDTSNYYRDFPGDTTPASLKQSANDTITQALSVSGVKLDPNVPLYAQVAWNRQVGSGDGDLTLTVGTKTASVTAAAQTGWNILRIALGANNWYDSFKEDQLDFKLTLANRTTGYILWDDIVIAPMSAFDNTWYAIVGGSTPFMTRDKATWTDSLSGSDSILQKWVWRAYNTYLPHDSSPTITDP